MTRDALYAVFALTAGGALVLYALFPADAGFPGEDALRFSNTQEWDPSVYAQRAGAPSFVGESAFAIPLPSPPENGSIETRRELALLHAHADARTEEELAHIRDELTLDGAHFGAYRFGDLRTTKSKTARLIDAFMPEFVEAVVRHKESFDRVRPSFLDPSLSTAIPVPGHPAYPSGHASQSMLIALVLGELDSANAAAYEESAVRIAHGREIAGVHYPSDSDAGRMLARAYYALLQQTLRYAELRSEARSEWNIDN
jgi:acid phosphatase (class A)